MLQIQNLSVQYGGIHAVNGISLEVQTGELVCLIGANGAGKTSTLKAISGLLPVASGSVLYQGSSITGMGPHQIAAKGLTLVPEGRGIFTRLSVEENLDLGAYLRKDSTQIHQDKARVFALFPRLLERHKQAAGLLSGGEQQMLAIGRALLARPTLLLLDEPSMGLAPLMVQKIVETIRAIAATGVTILLIEQNAKLALQISQRGYVMESGSIVLEDASSELLKSSAVRRAYLGEV